MRAPGLGFFGSVILWIMGIWTFGDLGCAGSLASLGALGDFGDSTAGSRWDMFKGLGIPSGVGSNPRSAVEFVSDAVDEVAAASDIVDEGEVKEGSGERCGHDGAPSSTTTTGDRDGLEWTLVCGGAAAGDAGAAAGGSGGGGDGDLVWSSSPMSGSLTGNLTANLVPLGSEDMAGSWFSFFSFIIIPKVRSRDPDPGGEAEKGTEKGAWDETGAGDETWDETGAAAAGKPKREETVTVGDGAEDSGKAESGEPRDRGDPPETVRIPRKEVDAACSIWVAMATFRTLGVVVSSIFGRRKMKKMKENERKKMKFPFMEMFQGVDRGVPENNLSISGGFLGNKGRRRRRRERLFQKRK